MAQEQKRDLRAKELDYRKRLTKKCHHSIRFSSNTAFVWQLEEYVISRVHANVCRIAGLACQFHDDSS